MHPLRLLSALRRDRRGIVATEFALIAVVLSTIFLVSIELGNSMWQASRVEAAARAGTGYGALVPTDTAGMVTAAQNSLIDSLGGDVGATISAVQICRCAGVDVDCAATPTCDDGNLHARYARVVVVRPRDSILNLPWLGLPANLTGDSEMRIQ